MKQPKSKKIKRYRSSFNRAAERGLVTRKIVSVIIILLLLFGVGWLLAKPGLDLGVKLWYQFKNGGSQSSSQASLPSQSKDLPNSESSSINEVSSMPETVPVASSDGRWAYVSLSSVTTADATAELARNLAAQGVSAAVIELKDSRGYVYYKTNVPTAQTSISATIIDAKAVAEIFAQNGITPIASICAFEDALAPKQDKSLAVTYQNQEEYLWLNNSAELGGVPWLNPYSSGAVQYITDILTEILDMGYKEVVIGSVQFPSGFGLELAGFGADATTRAKDVVLKDCVAKWQTQCEEKGVACWFSYKSVPALGEGDSTTAASPFTFGAKKLVLDFADSVTETDGTKNIDNALFSAAKSKADQNGAPKLCMRISKAEISGEIYDLAVQSALQAGFTGAFTQ